MKLNTNSLNSYHFRLPKMIFQMLRSSKTLGMFSYLQHKATHPRRCTPPLQSLASQCRANRQSRNRRGHAERNADNIAEFLLCRKSLDEENRARRCLLVGILIPKTNRLTPPPPPFISFRQF